MNEDKCQRKIKNQPAHLVLLVNPENPAQILLKILLILEILKILDILLIILLKILLQQLLT